MFNVFRRLNGIAKSVSPISFRELYECIASGKLIRQEIFVKELDGFIELIKSLGVSYSISSHCFKVPIDSNLDIWASTLENSLENDDEAVRLVYIHQRQTVCENAKLLDEKNDDLNLGLELQYPRCCIDAYCKWQIENDDIDPITTITNKFPFNGVLFSYDFPNPFGRYFGSGLYSHFPCSLYCQETKSLAEDTFNNLQADFPHAAHKLIQYEDALVIYHKEKGICLWTHFFVEFTTIKLDICSFQGQGDLKHIFAGVEKIQINNKFLHLSCDRKPSMVFQVDDCFMGAFRRQISLHPNS